MASAPPELSKKQSKELKKRKADFELACKAAKRAGDPPPACPPELVEVMMSVEVVSAGVVAATRVIRRCPFRVYQ